jgi:hypothetical protein
MATRYRLVFSLVALVSAAGCTTNRYYVMPSAPAQSTTAAAPADDRFTYVPTAVRVDSCALAPKLGPIEFNGYALGGVAVTDRSVDGDSVRIVNQDTDADGCKSTGGLRLQKDGTAAFALRVACPGGGAPCEFASSGYWRAGGR